MGGTCVRPISAADLTDVIIIHRLAFPGFLMTLLGPAFLRAYYQTVLDCSNSIFLGRFDAARRLDGFVAGFTDPVAFYALLARRKRKMLIAAALHLLFQPKLWPRVLENVDIATRRVIDDVPQAAELASIAVLPRAQGNGYGRVLIEAFLTQAQRLGAFRVNLTTDADRNEGVNRLYMKAGFKRVKVSTRQGGRRMNHYTFVFIDRAAADQQGEA